VLSRRIFCAALALTAGCNRDRRKVIAVIPKGTAHLFWLSVQAGALAAGRDLNVDVQWNGPALETEYDRQIQILDSMVARRVDGIAIAASDRVALVGPIERAVAAGIPVAVFDSGINSENYTTYVATDNYEAGQQAARTLAKLVGGRGSIAMVMHVPGSASSMERERGFDETIRAEFPEIRVVARQFGHSDRAKARAVTENILTGNPGLDGLFASTEPSSVGAALALKSRGLAGKIRFVSFDSSDGLIEELRAGVIDAMVVQDPFKMGYDAVKMLVEQLEGQTPPKKVDLRARVVTKADLDDAAVQRLLRPLAGG
jgi:ribose transport system substrate-binding protein